MSGQPKFCGNCGAPLDEGVNFCEACGQQIDKNGNLGVAKSRDSARSIVDPKPLAAEASKENTGRGNIFEIWRRVFLALFLCGAMCLAFYAPISSLFEVAPVDFAGEQKKMAKGYMGYVSEEKKRLAGLPLDGFINEVTKGKVFLLEGQQWDTFFNKLTSNLNGTSSDREWSGRIGEYRDRLYFRSGDNPAFGTSAALVEGSEFYLKLGATGQERYLRVHLEDLSDDSFKLGSSSSVPPSSVLYPYRRYCPWLALAGLALYILLPWPKARQNVVAYARWRIVLTDFASMLLLVMFFSLPIMIVGGTIQAVRVYFFFALIFWGFAAMAVWMLKMSAWLSGLQFEILPDRLRRITYRVREDYPFAGMDYVQPILQVPPRWLIWLSWFGAITGKSPGAAGNAMILSGSESGGFRIMGKDGRTCNIWLTDMRGKNSMPGSERILEALRNAGVPLKRDMHRFEGITVW